MKFIIPENSPLLIPITKSGAVEQKNLLLALLVKPFFMFGTRRGKEHYYYCFEEDMFWGEKEYNELENKAFNP